ncbi:MAG: hypothetical protein LBH59_01140 [Planctomycetaceae bacterium]|jgi:hypothetical protein|nr:hypothetical protein [Planctomycetaceae bacterium]
MKNKKQHNTNTTKQDEQIQIELEEISKLINAGEGDQALSRLEEAQRKFPNSLEIIALKLRIIRSSGNERLAYDIAKSILNNNPNHPLAISEYFLACAATNRPYDAINTLISYAESSNDALDQYIINSALELTYYLTMRGAICSAIGIAYCLRQFESVRTGADALIYNATSAQDTSLLIREFSFDYNCPENFTAKKEFEHATILISQLRWKEALKTLKSIEKHANEWTNLLLNIAVLHYWLIEVEAACEALKAYTANPNISTEEAADVEALRLAINPSLLGEPDQFLFAEYKITDANLALEKLLSSPLMAIVPFNQKAFVEKNQVPPKGIFKILDRPMPLSDAELTIDNIPFHIAVGMLFGKETDNEARIEIFDLPKTNLKILESTLKQVLGDLFVTNLAKTETAQSHPKSHNLAVPRLQSPTNHTLTAEQQRTLIEQCLTKSYLTQWLKTPFESLGNKTPIDAAQSPAYKVRVLGLLTMLEHDVLITYGEIGTNIVNKLREQLGYPLLDTIQIQGTTDDEQIAFINSIPVWRWYRLDIKSLSNRAIGESFQLINLLKEPRCLENFAQEFLSRPMEETDTQLRMMAYDKLIHAKRIINEFDNALDLIEKAKNEATLTNSIDAFWYMHEIPIRMVQNQPKRIEEILKYINNRYSNDEKVMRELYTLLVHLGLMRPDDQAGTNEPEIAGEKNAQQKSSEIWTPDNNNQPQEQTKSKLWTPD